MSIDRIHPAGDPIAHAGEKRRQLRRERRTEQELVEAIREDERQQGRTMTPGERDAFVRGFHGESYAQEIAFLAEHGLLDDEDGQE